MSDLSGRIAAMQSHYRAAGRAPVTATRKATDTDQPVNGGTSGDRGSVLAGTREGHGSRPRVNTMANRRNGGSACFYRPDAEYLAGGGPATTRPASGRVKPTGGRKVNGDRGAAGAASTDQSYREWAAKRAGLARDAGDVLPRGASYPASVTGSGNLYPRPEDY